MATIFYPTTGDFSTAVPYKVVAGYYVPYTGADAYGGTKLNVEKTQAFTPDSAVNCTGVWLLLNVDADATQSVTVKLQELVGGTTWTDRASKVMTYTDIYGTHYNEEGVIANTKIHYCSTYFQFATPYAITTDAGIWRISVQSTNGDAAYMYGAGGMAYGIVSDVNTSYASGDYVITKQGITMTIDQDLTLTSYFPGTDSILTWENPPVASYAFTLTNYYSTAHSKFVIGSEASPIPYAQKAVVTVTTFQSLLAWNYGGSNAEVEFWGEIPDAIQGTVAQNEATGQATITLTEDLSSSWQAGDSIHILGSVGTQIRTIQSVVGNVVTFTSNLGAVYKDWRAINVTRCTYYGITWAAGNLTPNSGGMDVYRKYSLSGIYIVNGVLVLNPTYPSAIVAGSTSLIEPLYVDNIYSLANASIDIGNMSTGYNTGADRYYGGGTISNIYHCTNNSSHNSAIRIMMPCVLTISHLYTDNYVNGIYIKTVGSTVSDCQVSSGWSGYGGGSYYGLMAYDCYSTELNDIRVSSLRSHFSGAKIIVNRFISDNCVSPSYGALDFIYSASGITFNNCNIGSGYPGTYVMSNGGVYIDAQFNNLTIGNSTALVPTTNPANLVEGSRIGFDTYDAITNDHRNYYKYGEIFSTGDGLTDTTVHTSGTGKFAIRFEPKSSTDNLEWDFDIPTGDIQNKTMTVGVWCKINSATYYAGTNQLPRLTIDYDNGTTAYCQAAETTDWQLLFVTFTPTTTYGQITVTLSGRTDATTTDAYIYFDDFTVAYPPSVALDLGGMDNWANALPVTPPIAIPISAGTVALNVWQQLTATSYGTGTMGEWVKKLLSKVIFWGTK